MVMRKTILMSILGIGLVVGQATASQYEVGFQINVPVMLGESNRPDHYNQETFIDLTKRKSRLGVYVNWFSNDWLLNAVYYIK
jgi:hypothetical protein